MSLPLLNGGRALRKKTPPFMFMGQSSMSMHSKFLGLLISVFTKVAIPA
jgi:hypothetical protein